MDIQYAEMQMENNPKKPWVTVKNWHERYIILILEYNTIILLSLSNIINQHYLQAVALHWFRLYQNIIARNNFSKDNNFAIVHFQKQRFPWNNEVVSIVTSLPESTGAMNLNIFIQSIKCFTR